MKVRLPRPEVKPLGMSVTWKVASSREPDLHYYVVVHKEGIECTCPGWRYNDTCWHVEYIQSLSKAELVEML